MIARAIRGPILNPTTACGVDYFPDGVLVADEDDLIVFCGHWSEFAGQVGANKPATETARGILCPPFLDAHIHVPQHPIRGRFAEGIVDHPPEGRLLAGLLRNVFPAEGKFADTSYALETIREFERDTLAHGVVGGAAYLTVHADAAEAALESMHRYWSVGPVLMNQNCPEYLQNDEFILPRIAAMAAKFGRRVIMTDRFAVAVNSALRTLACAEAERLGLRTQTHLNEQRLEKRFVEESLYPHAASYTDVYYRDGLLDHDAILAHCIHMSDVEFATVEENHGVIAHCPTSNTLLGSGIMPLDRVASHGIEWAICTDVGASPTTSMLCEMAQFLKVHAGRSRLATPSVALYRATLAPAKILGLDREIGRFGVGMTLSYLEIDPGQSVVSAQSADQVIVESLLNGRVRFATHAILDMLAEVGLDGGSELAMLEEDVGQTVRDLDEKVLSVTVAGQRVWKREPKSGEAR